MRRFLLGIVSLFLVTSLVPAYAAFSDVPADHVNTSAIQTLQTDGVLQGYADGSFHPDAQINRAEFVKIIVVGRYPMDAITACDRSRLAVLKDIDLNSWYAPYLCIALQESIITGYTDHTFRPTISINLSEVAAILARASREPLDRGMTETWYSPYIRWLDIHNAIPLTISKPADLLTRGEMAEIYYRIKHDDRRQPSRVELELEAANDIPTNYLHLEFMATQEAGNTIVFFGMHQIDLGAVQLAQDVKSALYTFQINDIDTRKPVILGVYLQIVGKEVHARAMTYDETNRNLRPMQFQHKDGTITDSVRADGISWNLGTFSISTPGVKTLWDAKNGLLIEH